MAYKLEFPSTSHTHPIFHAKHLGPPIPVQPSLPDDDFTIIKELEAILQRCMVPRDNKVVTEVLVNGENLIVLQPLWEPYWDLVRCFPYLTLRQGQIRWRM